MRTDPYLIDREGRHNPVGHEAQRFPWHKASGDIRLVGYHKQLEPSVAQTLERFFNAVVDFEFGEIPWRSGPPVPKNRLINHAIAIEEDCSLGHRHSGRMVKGRRAGPDCGISVSPARSE